MVKRNAPAAPRHSALLDAQQMTAGIAKLKRRISDLDALAPESIQNFSADAGAIATKINATLRDVFGDGTIEYNEYEVSRSSFLLIIIGGVSRSEQVRHFHHGIDIARSKLQTAIDVLTERLEDFGADARSPLPEEPINPAEQSDAIFVVHGHDEEAKAQASLFLTRAGLQPIILHEQANAGRTIVEKFEAHGGAVRFAVVLLTPDDVGGRRADVLKPRARQNVIAEMGWFSGKLGRERVCVLKKGDVEIPSDFHGVIYVDMDDRGAWRTELARELRAAGYKGDWEKALFG